jgi:hypothetical protein
MKDKTQPITSANFSNKPTLFNFINKQYNFWIKPVVKNIKRTINKISPNFKKIPQIEFHKYFRLNYTNKQKRNNQKESKFVYRPSLPRKIN